MGCICSKGVSEIDDCEREKELSKSSVQLAAPVLSKREEVLVEVIGGGGVDGSLRLVSKASSRTSSGPVNAAKDNEEKKNRIVERSTMDLGSSGGHPEMTKIINMPHGSKGEQGAAVWPAWLSSVAGEAIKGWVPRRAESFEKLDKVSFLIDRFFHCLLLSVQCIDFFDNVAYS
jgi:cyclin-dependent kinase 12/13